MLFRSDAAGAELRREPRAEEGEPMARRRTGHVDVRLGDVDISVRPDDRDRHARRAQRVALASDRHSDTRDVWKRDVGEEADVHAGQRSRVLLITSAKLQ